MVLTLTRLLNYRLASRLSWGESSLLQGRQRKHFAACCRYQSIAAAITERTTVQDLLEFVCSCCHLNPSVYFIRFNLPSTNTGSCDSFKIPDKTTVVCSEVRVRMSYWIAEDGIGLLLLLYWDENTTRAQLLLRWPRSVAQDKSNFHVRVSL